jgi:hypothetical protein
MLRQEHCLSCPRKTTTRTRWQLLGTLKAGNGQVAREQPFPFKGLLVARRAALSVGQECGRRF